MGDESTDTGVRIDMAPNSVSANSSGVPIDLTEWNRNDGFSPNSTMLTYVPGHRRDAVEPADVDRPRVVA